MVRRGFGIVFDDEVEVSNENELLSDDYSRWNFFRSLLHAVPRFASFCCGLG